MAENAAAFIAHKRDGGEHSSAEIADFIGQFLSGKVADYQMSAWLMAVYLRKMSNQETVALTHAMLHSGELLERGKGKRPRIDKHSTGGVGDKISLPLVGVAAACGLDVPMIAGRGLGHTGGTLDKLESISGFRVDLSTRDFSRVVGKAGACIIGQTKTIAPADRRMYALRDVTGTVACRPLIVASILSKKLAAGLDGLILDVKVGRGAFMKDARNARALARDLVRVAGGLGTPTRAVLSNMDRPLGRFIGNALEVRESIEILKGQGPRDSTTLTLELATEMLLLSGQESSRSRALTRAQETIDSGTAFERFCKMVELQGGDRRVLDDPRRLPRARHRVAVTIARTGYVCDVDPLALAEVAQDLGAGRKLVSDAIDPAVGIELCVQPTMRLKKGDTLCILHTQLNAAQAARLVERTRRAFTLGRVAPSPQKLIQGRIDG